VREKKSCSRRLLLCSTLPLSLVLLALPAWTQTYTVIYAFTAQDNLYAGSTLAQDAQGNLYGASWDSSQKCPQATVCGAIYKITPTGTETILHEFTGSPDGEYPNAVTIDATGNLYGTTLHGGTGTLQDYCSPNGCGTIFQITSSGDETILHSFNAANRLQRSDAPCPASSCELTDGILPQAGVAVGPNGELYGTTTFGGAGPVGPEGDGTIYEFANGEETILSSFTDGINGGLPGVAPLLRNGNLYGTTTFGGTGPCLTSFGYGCGTVFEYDETGERALYEFQNGADGGFPAASLIADSKGNLYGTTVLGGDTNCELGAPPPGCGVVFKLSTAGKETVLHTFTGQADGAWPSAALVMDTAGNLYGTAYYGGDLNCTDGFQGCGTIFEIDTLGNFSVMHTFEGADGAVPGALILNGSELYGVAGYGGAADRGVVYELSLP
jgi:uncharacterized repeat protein (TIGR03803 family)